MPIPSQGQKFGGPAETRTQTDLLKREVYSPLYDEPVYNNLVLRLGLEPRSADYRSAVLTS